MSAESALIAAIPEAEALVGPYRSRFDPSAALGVPAHVTVLYPFRAPALLDDQTLWALRQCCAAQAPIDLRLRDLRRFPGGTLYLAPEPAEPFRRLTIDVWRHFPDTPPYGGQWPDIIPHLTIAQAVEGDELDTVARELGRVLAARNGIAARVGEISLIENTAGAWVLRERFRLGP